MQGKAFVEEELVCEAESDRHGDRGESVRREWLYVRSWRRGGRASWVGVSNNDSRLSLSLEVHECRFIQQRLFIPRRSLADDVEVGPFCVIGEHVTIGKGTRLLSHVTVDGWTEIGERNEVHPFVSIGGPPQHLGYKGEPTKVIIGHDNILREYVTVNRATAQGGGVTSLGSKNFLMAYVHVAHDCRLGNHLILANAASLAGHITIGDHAIIGGLTGIHQYVRIGSYSMVGGCCALGQDLPAVHAGWRVAIAHGCMASIRWGCADTGFRPIGFRC